MKRLMLPMLAMVLFATGAQAQPEIGKPAPEIQAVDALTGKPFTLSALKGKTVVLEWNNFGCPFVKKFYSVGAMQAQQAEAAKAGVVWVSINSSAAGKEGHLADSAAVKAALEQAKATPAHYLLDAKGVIGKAYGAKTTPHMFVVNAEGNVAYMGAIDDKDTADSADIKTAKNHVREALAALAEGKTPAVTSTRPYGCFVKY